MYSTIEAERNTSEILRQIIEAIEPVLKIDAIALLESAGISSTCSMPQPQEREDHRFEG